MKTQSNSTADSSVVFLGNEKPDVPEGRLPRWLVNVLRLLGLLALLYTFVCSLDLLSSAFRLLAGKTTGSAFTSNALVNNPVAALMMGVIATVVVQSSSTSTSIIVAMVSSGILKVQPAIPIIMGANIGTSITNTFVALAQSGDRAQFRRAFAGATVHDMFNWMTVIVLLPLEVATSFLFYTSSAIVTSMRLDTVRGLEFDLLKTITSPVTSNIIQLDKTVIEQVALGNEAYMDEPIKKVWCAYRWLENLNSTATNSSLAPGYLNQTSLKLHRIGTEKCSFLFNLLSLADVYVGLILLAFALGLLCTCLILLVKLLHSMMQASLARVIIKTINADLPGRAKFLTGYLALLVGTVMTMLVQSSSVFTSALTPLAGIGAISMEKLYPLTLGSNIGTTVTGILAALAAPGDKLPIALQIALCHLLFNLSGTLLFFPIPPLRRVPLALARFLGRKTATYRWFAVLYILVTFVLVPGTVCFLSIVGGPVVLGSVLVPTVVLIALVGLVNYLQIRRPSVLPLFLRDWNFLPLWMHSLRPLDSLISKCLCRRCRSTEQAAEPEKADNSTEEKTNGVAWSSVSSVATTKSSVCLLTGSSYITKL